MPSESPDDDRDHSAGSTVSEETTRVPAVRYLEGASGHGVLSLLFLLIAAGLLHGGMFGEALLAGIVAYGVAINGLTIYLWDKFRLYFETAFDSDEHAATRTLTPHRVSAEMKAELASGAVIVGGLGVFLGIVLAMFRTLGFQQTVLLAVGGLALGNLGVLGLICARS